MKAIITFCDGNKAVVFKREPSALWEYLTGVYNIDPYGIKEIKFEDG